MLILKETGDEDKLINLDKIPWLKAHAEGFTFSSVQDMIELIEKTRYMIKHNGNYQLSVENMLIDIQGGIRCIS
jgi:DNA polymerase-3 subunit delta'